MTNNNDDLPHRRYRGEGITATTATPTDDGRVSDRNSFACRCKGEGSVIEFQWEFPVLCYFVFGFSLLLFAPLRCAIRIVVDSAARAFSSADLSSGENVVVPLIANSLEWALSSPPPLHQFTEPPLVVETDHLDIHPGKEVEEVLAAQGHEVTDIIGKEKWVLNDPANYEGLIPQNAEWTEFIDEKTGEWVYLDEYGNKVDKP